jgi:hypothetical protein
VSQGRPGSKVLVSLYFPWLVVNDLEVIAGLRFNSNRSIPAINDASAEVSERCFRMISTQA